jgi:hypothetical protein
VKCLFWWTQNSDTKHSSFIENAMANHHVACWPLSNQLDQGKTSRCHSCLPCACCFPENPPIFLIHNWRGKQCNSSVSRKCWGCQRKTWSYHSNVEQCCYLGRGVQYPEPLFHVALSLGYIPKRLWPFQIWLLCFSLKYEKTIAEQDLQTVSFILTNVQPHQIIFKWICR